MKLFLHLIKNRGKANYLGIQVKSAYVSSVPQKNDRIISNEFAALTFPHIVVLLVMTLYSLLCCYLAAHS
jgi:hypothetical protein